MSQVQGKADPAESTRKIYMGERIFRPENKRQLSHWINVGTEFHFQVVRAQEDPSEILLQNLRIPDLFKVLSNKRLRSLPRRAFVTEPKVVLPHLHWPVLRRVFPEILWLGRPQAEKTYANPYRFPAATPLEMGQERKATSAFIFANKISMTKGELYTLRRQVASSATNVEVFGSGWNRSLGQRLAMAVKEAGIALMNPKTLSYGARNLNAVPKKYLGVAGDKISTLREYKVCIVIENSLESVTEKIFDAWVAGCIPVYVGPDLASIGFPSSLFIQTAPELDSVLHSLDLALGMNHEEFKTELDNWLPTSKAIQFWSWKIAMNRVINPE